MFFILTLTTVSLMLQVNAESFREKHQNVDEEEGFSSRKFIKQCELITLFL